MLDAGLEKRLRRHDIAQPGVKRLRRALGVTPYGRQRGRCRHFVQPFHQRRADAGSARRGEHGDAADLATCLKIDAPGTCRTTRGIMREHMHAALVALVELDFDRDLLFLHEHGQAHVANRVVIGIEASQADVNRVQGVCSPGELVGARLCPTLAFGELPDKRRLHARPRVAFEQRTGVVRGIVVTVVGG